jgi:hypothetical protein
MDKKIAAEKYFEKYSTAAILLLKDITIGRGMWLRSLCQDRML